MEELVRERRRFVIPALALFFAWFGGFLVLTGYARHFMAQKAIGSVTWAWVLALSLVVMTWAIAWAYLRWSTSRLDPLAERAAREASPEEQR